MSKNAYLMAWRPNYSGGSSINTNISLMVDQPVGFNLILWAQQKIKGEKSFLYLSSARTSREDGVVGSPEYGNRIMATDQQTLK